MTTTRAAVDQVIEGWEEFVKSLEKELGIKEDAACHCDICEQLRKIKRKN